MSDNRDEIDNILNELNSKQEEAERSEGTESSDSKKEQFSLNIGDEDALLEKIEIKKEEKQYEKPNDKTVQKKKKRRKKRIKEAAKGISALVYILIVTAISFALAIYGLIALNDYLGLVKKDEMIQISIPENATTGQVAKILKEKGVISQEMTFRIYMSLAYPNITYFSDMYTLNPHDGYAANVQKIRLTAEAKEEIEVTIPEGTTLSKIIDILTEKEVCSSSRLADILDTADFTSFEFVKNLPKTEGRIYDFEGYLFPDTYRFYKNDAEISVVKKIFENTKAKLTPAHYEKAEKLGMTMDEVITLASIIQKEAGLKSEMHKVASVFHNRLKPGSPFPKLQSDVTCWYPHERRDDVPKSSREEFYNRNKYNTYVINGLPPGPICNPGIEAINAALEPDSTEYYFFVTDVNSKYYYGKTLKEHEKNCATAERQGIKTGTDTHSEDS